MKANIAIFESIEYNDCTKIVDLLRDKTLIFINLEKCEYEAATNILDFLTGALSALNGGMEEITQNCFFLYPEEIEIEKYRGDLLISGHGGTRKRDKNTVTARAFRKTGGGM